MFGYVVKMNESFYVIKADPTKKGSGYGVVPKDEDPYNKYNIEDVIIYYNSNPDKRLNSDHMIIMPDEEASIRMQRDALLEKALIKRDTCRDNIDMGTATKEALVPILEYIQLLRDVPQQEGFPSNVVWPDIPWVTTWQKVNSMYIIYVGGYYVGVYTVV